MAKEKKDSAAWLFIPGGVLLGLGLGVALGNAGAGVLIGLGAGFIVTAVILMRMKEKI